MMFKLPPLPYPADALTPVISELTLRIHHGKHHAKYIETTNALLADRSELRGSLEDVVRLAAATGDQKLFNNAGQAWNHGFFWACMTPHNSQPGRPLLEAIERDFGDVSRLKAKFVETGAAHFGSGWVWLVAQEDGLRVISTHDGDTALTHPGAPLLVCDVWEHAYYLDHKNDRAGFLISWWDRLVNWTFVAVQYEASRGGVGPWRFPHAEAPAHAES